ncbi:MAG: zinc ribbon domain-containing protein [Xenococcaceae cyanobacterium MO_234.B1]|nr:zinc ribbon domain-containing protein [Xenococcaceae cyanobacterium MO_234.B1]
MARKKISKTEYCITWQAQGFNNETAELAKGIEIANRLGKLRQDIWNKYGSLQAWGYKSDKLIKEFKQTNPPSLYQVAYKPWERTFQSVIDDIHAVQEAAKSFVIRKIYRYFQPEKIIVKGKTCFLEHTSFRKELVKSLNSTEFMQYPLIKRWVRQEYHRGHTWVKNQIVLDASDCNITRSGSIVTISLPGEPKGKRSYERINLKFRCGRVKPTGRLRIIFEDDNVRLCYPKVVTKQENHNTSIVGIDKGYTEGFYGSDGVVYADGIGKLMTAATEKHYIKGKRRQKLWALSTEKPHSFIHSCNLGTKNQNKSQAKVRATLRTLIRTGVHQIFDSHLSIVCEDLSQPIRNKGKSKKINRRLAAWCKGELQQALEQVSQRRQSVVTLINPAYTSQVDSRNGTLLGRRDGDRFFTFDGEVLQADSNASMNIKNRLTDTEIGRYQKAAAVQKILLKRTASFLALMGLTLEDALNRGWLHSKHLNSKRARKAAT